MNIYQSILSIQVNMIMEDVTLVEDVALVVANKKHHIIRFTFNSSIVPKSLKSVLIRIFQEVS